MSPFLPSLCMLNAEFPTPTAQTSAFQRLLGAGMALHAWLSWGQVLYLENSLTLWLSMEKGSLEPPARPPSSPMCFSDCICAMVSRCLQHAWI